MGTEAGNAVQFLSIGVNMNFATNLVIFVVPAGVAAICSLASARSSRGIWKWLAWTPVVPLAVWAVVISRDLGRDPTSHNLWPFEFVGVVVITILLFAAFHTLRWIATPSQRKRP